MILMQPKKAANGQTSSMISTGVDTGAGLLKLALGTGTAQQRVRTPAKIVEVREELHDELTSPEGGHFFYHDGSRQDLKGRQYLTGSLAAWKAPTSHIKLSDNPALKAEYVLHMILGALASLPPRKLESALSSQQPQHASVPGTGHHQNQWHPYRKFWRSRQTKNPGCSHSLPCSA